MKRREFLAATAGLAAAALVPAAAAKGVLMRDVQLIGAPTLCSKPFDHEWLFELIDWSKGYTMLFQDKWRDGRDIDGGYHGITFHLKGGCTMGYSPASNELINDFACRWWGEKDSKDIRKFHLNIEFGETCHKFSMVGPDDSTTDRYDIARIDKRMRAMRDRGIVIAES